MIGSGFWNRCRFRLSLLRREEGGQVLPMVCVVMVGMLGMAALAVDMGRAMYCSRELQASTDAAALAAARAMPTAASLSAITGTGGVVATYSAAAGGYNYRSSLPGVVWTATPECLSTLKTEGMPCTGNVPYNAIQVRQAASITTFFGGIIGIRTMPLSSTSTASIHGGAPRPANIAVVLDTTLSMNIYDSDCGMTALQCELNGFQVLLQSLNPCGLYQTACSPAGGVAVNAFDAVSLFTFPNVSVGTASIDTSCTYGYNASTASKYNWINISPYGWGTYLSSNNDPPYPGLATGLPYSFPTPGTTYAGLSASTSSPTYQITPFLSDYRTSDTAKTLNANSLLVKAAGAVSNCGSMAPPNYEIDYETYYAGAIYAAQSALVSAYALAPSSENVMIILSDGDSNALQSGGELDPSTGYPNMSASAPSGNYLNANGSGSYPSWVGECGQAVAAAAAATSAGTLVYSVGYGSEPSGCGTDANAGSHPNITPCQTMAQMASAPQYFYSDYNQGGSQSTCVSGQPATSLSGIFAAIAADLSEARLIPNNTV